MFLLKDDFSYQDKEERKDKMEKLFSWAIKIAFPKNSYKNLSPLVLSC